MCMTDVRLLNAPQLANSHPTRAPQDSCKVWCASKVWCAAEAAALSRQHPTSATTDLAGATSSQDEKLANRDQGSKDWADRIKSEKTVSARSIFVGPVRQDQAAKYWLDRINTRGKFIMASVLV